jgi:integrase
MRGIRADILDGRKCVSGDTASPPNRPPNPDDGSRLILSAEAQKLLRGQLEHHKGVWVFPSPDGRPYSRVDVSRVFRKAARAAGLKDFTFHDLRHHGATMALNRNFSAPIVQALGGWKTERMMKRYAAVTDQTLRAAAEAVSGAEAFLKIAKIEVISGC